MGLGILRVATASPAGDYGAPDKQFEEIETMGSIIGILNRLEKEKTRNLVKWSLV